MADDDGKVTVAAEGKLFRLLAAHLANPVLPATELVLHAGNGHHMGGLPHEATASNSSGMR